VPGVCRMRKGADDDRGARHRPRHSRKGFHPLLLRRAPQNLKSAHAATAIARTPGQSPAIISTHRFPAPISRNISVKGESHARGSLLPRTPGPRLDLGPVTPQPRAASAHRQRTRPQQHPRPARKRIHPFCARRGARLSRYLPAPRRPPDGLRDRGTRPSPRRRPHRRPAGPPPNRDRPLRHRRGCRRRHRPGPGRRTGPGRLPGRARRRTPGLGTRPGLPGAMRAVPEAVPGAAGRIAPPDGNGAGMQPALTAPPSADRPPHGLHITHPGTPRRSDAYDPPVVHLDGYACGSRSPGSTSERVRRRRA
jgi:hypothetical protein